MIIGSMPLEASLGPWVYVTPTNSRAPRIPERKDIPLITSNDVRKHINEMLLYIHSNLYTNKIK